MNSNAFHQALNLDREKILMKIKEVFESFGIESHILGSVARGETDPYSDLDVWITFEDDTFASIMKKRWELFKKIGNVVRVIEPHQNAPINGIFSAVLYKTFDRLLPVDFYLCPKSTTFITTESKNLFGDESSMPIGVLGLNPQTATVTKDYRIDFCIGFLFGSIKKLVRKNENPLVQLLKEYNYLRERYDIPVKEIYNPEHTFSQLFQVAENIKIFANDNQKKVISEIENFAHLVEMNEIN